MILRPAVLYMVARCESLQGGLNLTRLLQSEVMLSESAHQVVLQILNVFQQGVGDAIEILLRLQFVKC